jgi:hypothetical protein
MPTTVYHRDPTVPYWRSNTDMDALLEDHAIRQGDALTMCGHFEAGILGDHTYSFTFTPNDHDEPAIVFPVYEKHRLVDLLAISQHDHRIWGCVTGAGQFIGNFSNAERTDRTLPIVLHVHDTPYSWLKSDCDGVLPLAKAFFPLMQFASTIVAQDADHAEKIANEAFINPAERFGLDCGAAEQAALDRISFAA